MQEALEFETKRREQAEQTLKQAASTDSLRVLNGKKPVFASVSLTFNLSAKKSLVILKIYNMMESEKNLFSFLHSSDTSLFIALLLYILCANKLRRECSN